MTHEESVKLVERFDTLSDFHFNSLTHEFTACCDVVLTDYETNNIVAVVMTLEYDKHTICISNNIVNSLYFDSTIDRLCNESKHAEFITKSKSNDKFTEYDITAFDTMIEIVKLISIVNDCFYTKDYKRR